MNKVRIDIDTRTFVRFWLVVLGFAVAALLLYSARTALLIIGAAFFLALALNPPVSRLAKILPGKSRVGGTALAYVAVVIVLGVIVFLVVPPIVEQTAKFAQTVPALLDNASKQYHGINDLINHYHLRPQVDQIVNSVKSSTASLASGFGKNILSGIGSVVSIFTAGILILALTFFMLVEGPIWLTRLWSAYNNEARMVHHRELLQRMYTVVTGYVIGQLIISAIDGAISGITVVILSFFFPIPADLAIPTAAIMFTLSLIPLFGATIGALLVGVILALNSLTAAIIFIVLFVIYQQIEANVVSPRVQSKKIDLSALAVLAAVTIGIYLFGVAGAIISIPIAGCIRVLMEDYFARAKQNRIASIKPSIKHKETVDSANTHA